VLVGMGNCSNLQKVLWAQAGAALATVITWTPSTPPDADFEHITTLSVVVSQTDSLVLLRHLNTTVSLKVPSKAQLDPAAVFLVSIPVFCVAVASSLVTEGESEAHHYRPLLLFQEEAALESRRRRRPSGHRLNIWFWFPVAFAIIFAVMALFAIVAAGVSLVVGGESFSQ